MIRVQVRSLFSLSFARIIYRVLKENTTAKKEPALKDSRFHINNTSQSIKALGQYRERVIITSDNAFLIDKYLVTAIWRIDREAGVRSCEH